MSRFLPAGFDPSRPFALLAGKGHYPRLVLEEARRAGVPVRLVAFEDETDAELVAQFPEAERRTVKVGQVGKFLDALRHFGAPWAMMAGQITPKRLFRGLHPDLKAISLLFQLKERNAETIFGAIAREMEKVGTRLVDGRAFLDDHLASAGCMTARTSRIDPATLEHGVRIAREVARLDIGQGVVVAKGTVLAVEAFEGTNEMLRRAGTFGADDPVFVKVVKPAQDWRIDVPVFGLRTVEVLRESGIRAAALEAGATLMLEKPRVLAAAREAGIELAGF